MNLFVFNIALVGVILNALAQLSIKKGTLNGIDIVTFKGLYHTIIANPFIILGLSFYVLSVGSWIYVLSKAQVSVAYPLLSLGYVFNLIVAYYFFNEPITLYKVIGLTLILVGVIFITR